MKKILKFILPCLIIFILMGCELNNTPTSKVEERLSKYQMTDKVINIDDKMQFLTDVNVLTEDQKEDYHEIVSKQYKSLSYNVKDETVDGESAVVEVQIEVMNYKKAIDEFDLEMSYDGMHSEQYHSDRIEKLMKVKDKVTYTIEFNVNKDNDGNWKLEELDSSIEQKILGIY